MSARLAGPGESGRSAFGRRADLLLVALDDVRRPDFRAIGVLAELAQRASLPQEIPALVELDLELTQALALLVGLRAPGVERMLLVDEASDMGEHGLIVRLVCHGFLDGEDPQAM